MEREHYWGRSRKRIATPWGCELTQLTTRATDDSPRVGIRPVPRA